MENRQLGSVATLDLDGAILTHLRLFVYCSDLWRVLAIFSDGKW